MEESPSQNVGLDLLRVTESAAIAAGRFIGLGDKDSTHIAATQAMSNQLKMIDIDGHIVVGEEVRLGEHSSLDSGVKVGTTRGPKTDVVVDPIDVGYVTCFEVDADYLEQFPWLELPQKVRCGLRHLRRYIWIRSLLTGKRLKHLFPSVWMPLPPGPWHL